MQGGGQGHGDGGGEGVGEAWWEIGQFRRIAKPRLPRTDKSSDEEREGGS